MVLFRTKYFLEEYLGSIPGVCEGYAGNIQQMLGCWWWWWGHNWSC